MLTPLPKIPPVLCCECETETTPSAKMPQTRPPPNNAFLGTGTTACCHSCNITLPSPIIQKGPSLVGRTGSP